MFILILNLLSMTVINGIEEDSNTHCCYCECGNYEMENHNLDSLGNCIKCGYYGHIHSYTYTSLTSSTHNYTCVCGLSGNDNHSFNSSGVCINCGYQQHVHSYTYCYYDSTYHRKTCSCGMNELEQHLWAISSLSINIIVPDALIGPKTCRYCGVSSI